MRTATIHPLVADYRHRLRRAARALPRARRTELVAEIEAHLEEALPPDPTEIEVRNMLERLGEPEEIVAAEDPDIAPAAARARAGSLEWFAIVLLLVGGLVVPVLGWGVGVVLLWSSRVWTRREKLIGTFVPPGGLSLVVLALVLGVGVSSETCSGGGGSGGQTTEQCTGGMSTPLQVVFVVLLVAGLVLPFVTATYLGRRAQRAR
ncbi:MAG: hypothetical protein JWN32_4022 [Solirubrobacterales bacterium]|jgi:hypothetical protein|nr:hypothetical protein [Solirubrobacterales bacterium]